MIIFLQDAENHKNLKKIDENFFLGGRNVKKCTEIRAVKISNRLETILLKEPKYLGQPNQFSGVFPVNRVVSSFWV